MAMTNHSSNTDAAKRTTTAKPVKSRAGRKASARRRPASRAASAKANRYARRSATPANILARGRSALTDAYSWVDEKRHSISPGSMLPSHASVRHVSESPLLLGAMGLGLGLLIGSVMPSVYSGRVHDTRGHTKH